MSKPQQTIYTCKECGAPAGVVDGIVAKSCDHSDAPVVAHLSAVARGVSGMASGKTK